MYEQEISPKQNALITCQYFQMLKTLPTMYIHQ